MRKQQEIKESTSCLNQSRDNELIFVLCARDKSAPDAIRAWCQSRILRQLNKPTDSKIIEALNCADNMERER